MPKLSETALCLDCDETFKIDRNGVCPVCGSREFWPLGKWLMNAEDSELPLPIVGATGRSPVQTDETKEILHG